MVNCAVLPAVWQPGDIPVPGNYFNDGKAYLAVLRSGKVYLQNNKQLEKVQLMQSL
ncbi:hypothetical protein IDJ75_19925 [Mucilaginibacter rigui]|uniref:Uncharacterized protein n=1 Tax=Mucilaginibacter rigui TaxID=534635 RepID=A0ABR7XAE4_9SPHI|nr:hypothetical protein [Mucilaginibacter rigui]MBD1387563.1 hypothetical protein [Mucilaginibacter rigui]